MTVLCIFPFRTIVFPDNSRLLLTIIILPLRPILPLLRITITRLRAIVLPLKKKQSIINSSFQTKRSLLWGRRIVAQGWTLALARSPRRVSKLTGAQKSHCSPIWQVRFFIAKKLTKLRNE